MNVSKRSLFVLSSLVVAANCFAQSIYRVVDLGTFGGTHGEARAINAAGHAVGWADATPPTGGFAFLYSGGPLINLGTIAGSNGSQATAINNSGSIAGYAYVPAINEYRAFQIVGGSMTPLGTLGFGSYAYGMNSTGQIVGGSSPSSQVFHACLYSGGAVTDLGSLGGNASVAYDINDSGVIVGRSNLPIKNSADHAVQWKGGAINRLKSPVWVLGSEATTINNAGQIAGNLQRRGSSANERIHAMFYSEDQMFDLGHLAGYGTFAEGMNELGDVVGWGYAGANPEFYGPTNGFVTSGTSIINLNKLVDQAYSGWSIQAAYGINDDGVIAGSAKFNQGNARPVLLVPLDKPSTINVPPSSLEAVRGTIERGGLAHCVASDGRLLVIKPKLIPPMPSSVQVELTAVSPLLNPSAMRIVFNTHCIDGPFWDSILLFDFVANQWVDVHNSQTDENYSRQTKIIPCSAPARFVQPGTGKMKARIVWSAFRSGERTSVLLDRATWLLTE